MTLEVDFFQAAMKDGGQPNVGLLVLDFDETLSVSDTTSVIIDTAIAAAADVVRGKQTSHAMMSTSCNTQVSGTASPCYGWGAVTPRPTCYQL